MNRLSRCLIICAVCMSGIISCYSIVFVHIGKNLPVWAYTAMGQARLFNKECPLYLLANQSALDTCSISRLRDAKVTTVPLESLSLSDDHKHFLKMSCLPKDFRDGFWFYASERFMYLADFAALYPSEDMIHLETDVMIYADFSKTIDLLRNKYQGLGLTLDNDVRCIPGLVYFRDAYMVKMVASYFAENASLCKSDMEILAMFYHANVGNELVGTLPVIMPEYYERYGFKSTTGLTTNKPERFFNNITDFNGIFDACAMGQYIGGGDPRNGNSKPGFINESTLFSCSHIDFIWELDEAGRRVPCALYAGRKYKIYNLHIHSKNLDVFS